MAARFLLDTNVVLRWLVEPGKLSKEQTRVLDEAVRRAEPVGISAISLLEIAVLCGQGSHRIKADARDIFDAIQSNPIFEVFPLTIDIATEVASLGGVFRDPADRAIVATARVHRLRLLTSDQSILDSSLVSTVE